MRRRVTFLFYVLPFILLAGCASGGSSSDAGPSGRLTFDAGMGSENDIQAKVARVLTRHQYEIYRAEPVPNLHFETYWRERYPLSDEEEQGLTAGRTRILIRTRARSRSAAGDLFAVTLVAENLMQQGKNAEWVPMEPTPDFRKYMKKIADDIKLELNSGIRVF